MLCVGIALIPDILYTVYMIGCVLGVWTLHPIFAVAASCIMLGLYVAVAFINILITYSNERGFEVKEGWQKVAYVEAGFQGVLGLCYAGMLGASCVAVSVWKKNRRGVRNGVVVETLMDLGSKERG